MNIKAFGPVDDRSLQQLKRCMKAGDAEFGVLCADHHPGYSQPIGGGIAYEGYVSPSGVGFDIGCIRGEARVTGADGSSLPLRATSAEHPAVCWDGTAVRRVAPSLGALNRGQAQVVALRLVNGRELVATRDHEVRTKLGRRAMGELRPGDAVACLPYIGFPHELPDDDLPVAEPATPSTRVVVRGVRAQLLARRGLWPVRWADPRLPALVRLLGYNCGDGALSRDGKRVSYWTSVAEDAAALERDVRRLGFNPRRHDRTRPNGSREHHVYIGSVELHALLAAMGAPVGKKAWPADPLTWLFDAPAWIRAVFLSAFASAEASAPRLVDGRIPNLAIKQAGESPHAAEFVVRLMRSLGFEASDPAPSGPPYGGRRCWVVQLLGGEAGQLRFFEEVGFCLAAEKRRAAAAVASVAWQRAAAVARRQAAWEAARGLRATTAAAAAAVSITAIARSHRVPRGFVYHCWYDPLRGRPRSAKGWSSEPDHSGEIAWVQVASIDPAGEAEVYDLATADPAEAFIAEGIVVHNCGNKAVETDLKVAVVDQAGGIRRVMDEISERISFGMGVPARERVDHPVLDKIRNAPFEGQRTLADTAAKQLGTVGSGNHYVNVFADENDVIWIGVHFGSRGFGHKTATGFLAVAQGLPFDEGERKRHGLKVQEGGMDSPPVLLPVDSEAGQAYIEAMNLAGEYAYAGRDVVVDNVLDILGARPVHEVHNHHNMAFREEHFGRKVWVVRKGCTPAWPGQEGFVGASMGGDSVILEGFEGTESKESLYSTVHGAGRVMSRMKAAGKVRRRKRWACSNRDCDRVFETQQACPDHPRARVRMVRVEERIRPGLVDWEGVKDRLRKQDIVLVGGGADEAPEVYKSLPDVLASHGDSIRVRHTLRPLGVAMAGRDAFDPYKD